MKKLATYDDDNDLAFSFCESKMMMVIYNDDFEWREPHESQMLNNKLRDRVNGREWMIENDRIQIEMRAIGKKSHDEIITGRDCLD